MYKVRKNPSGINSKCLKKDNLFLIQGHLIKAEYDLLH